MKNIVLLFTAALSLTSFANTLDGYDVYEVDAKYCDQEQVEKREGEIFFVNMEKSEVGFGYTDENGCKHLEYAKTVVSQSENYEDNKVFTGLTITKHENSCVTVPTDATWPIPVEFSAEFFAEGEIGQLALIKLGNDCKEGTLYLKKKD